MRFENKVAIITGGGSGIGREAAKTLVAEGAKVVINGRRADKLEEAARDIDPMGRSVAILAGDISDVRTAGALANLAEERFGSVDILINNAGIFAPKGFLDHTEEDFDAYSRIILKGSFFAAQAAAKAMRRRGGGVIVNTGSMWATQAIGATPSSAYSAAKAGVHALTVAKKYPVFPTTNKRPCWSNAELGVPRGEGGYKIATQDLNDLFIVKRPSTDSRAVLLHRN